MPDKISEELRKLELYAGELATEAIAAFKDAECAVHAYNKDIYNIIESTDGNVKDAIWGRYVSLNFASENLFINSTSYIFILFIYTFDKLCT